MKTETRAEGLSTFRENVKALHELADVPEGREQLRIWVQRHPRNLMAYCGWECQDFHEAGIKNFLNHPSSLWLAPRGSGKSTVAVFIGAWLGIADPRYWDPEIQGMFEDAPREVSPKNIRIGVTSNSHPKAVTLLWQIKAILASRPIAKLFGPLAGKRWKDELADTRLRVSDLREPTYTALGLGSKIAGGHYDVVLADDWVTLDNARTKLQRERIADFWAFTVKGTCEPWARVGVYGTRYHPQDWYGTIHGWSAKDMGWNVLRHPAIMTDANGEQRSYWPAMYSLDKLEEIRNEIGSIAFSTQYMNEVELMLGDFFEASWLEHFETWAELPARTRESARTGMALDPAFKGGPKRDWSVFSICHFVRPKRFHFERIVRGQWTKDELIKQAERLYKEHRPSVFAIEAGPGVEFLIQDMRASRVIPRQIVKAMAPRVSKIARADKGRTLFETGCVSFDPPNRANQLQIAIDELLGFTGEPGGQDDCVDSMIWNLITLTRGRGRLIRAPGVHRAR